MRARNYRLRSTLLEHATLGDGWSASFAPLAIKSAEIEKWFLELRKGNPQKKVKPFADPTVDKIRRIMHLVYKHGQRHEFLPRQQEGNPMNWVSQRTTSDYTAVPMTP